MLSVAQLFRSWIIICSSIILLTDHYFSP